MLKVDEKERWSVPCEGCCNPLGRKLGLSQGKPAADPARPELGQLDGDGNDDGNVAGGFGEFLGVVDSRPGGQNQRAQRC